MAPAMTDAIRRVSALQVGDRVTMTVDGRDYAMTVSRGPRRSDGMYGSAESTRVTVTLGPGRWSTELIADAVASGRQSFTVTA